MQENNIFDDRHLADNEEVIAKTINYLKYKDPTKANREYAIKLLTRMQEVALRVGNKSALSIEKFIDQYEEESET
jgi:hypothetical protein